MTGTDTDGNTKRLVGAILWDTLSGTWQIRGRADDLRNCVITSKVSCTPPYSYAMSSNGDRQFFSQPTAERMGIPIPANAFETTVGFSDTGSPQETSINDTGTVRSLDTNTDGDLLLFRAGESSEALSEGYALYQVSTNTTLSLNGAMNECAVQDNTGNSADDSQCVYSTTPFSTTSDGAEFNPGGRQILFRSISRFTHNREQSVLDFVHYVDEATLYTLPDSYTANTESVNADATVFIGNTGFPEYDILIGKR